MKKEALNKLHFIYNILLSILIVISGICLIAGCLSIYYSGKQPYSREAVATVFSKISFPVYLCLFMTVIGLIWEFISPVISKKSKPQINRKFILQNLYSKKDFDALSDDIKLSVSKEKNLRKTHSIIRTVIILISSVIFLIYALNPANFHQSEINGSMIKAMFWLIPCLAVSFAYSLFTAFFIDKSLKREAELIKQAPTAQENEKAITVASTKKLNILRILLLVLSIAVLLYGFFTGGFADVLTKAVNICTECIGLG